MNLILGWKEEKITKSQVLYNAKLVHLKQFRNTIVPLVYNEFEFVSFILESFN